MSASTQSALIESEVNKPATTPKQAIKKFHDNFKMSCGFMFPADTRAIYVATWMKYQPAPFSREDLHIIQAADKNLVGMVAEIAHAQGEALIKRMSLAYSEKQLQNDVLVLPLAELISYKIYLMKSSYSFLAIDCKMNECRDALAEAIQLGMTQAINGLPDDAEYDNTLEGLDDFGED